ncbi:histidine phosphatase family protein [Duganella sp. FT80W]|uniref:Histidine phosphatase family protein n=1 Tax=Duganella guangzhouensis TaxID=2666084 RepID=A0A6I2L034_9BURK|nr:histidine phosphatase family protein [Duganella guangzhouensis]MRW91508.1 histidine phosphatase family protein [Duganella guangzhouensis]
MGQIYLVRHGQASFGSANYDQLSTLGYEQARLLGQWYANRQQSFSHVITGGMARHRQTADTCLGELPKQQLVDAEWITDEDFAEFDHHEVLLRHVPEFADAVAFKALLANHVDPPRALEHLFRAAMQRWMSGWHDDEYSETWPDFRRRCIRALERLDTDTRGQEVIVFTSGGVIATLMQHLLGLQDFQVMELNWTLANCAVTKILQRPGQFTLGYLNNYAHLEWLGQPGAVTYR